jgi:hypothetical protein
VLDVNVGAALTAETMQRLIERADQEKHAKAEARLTASPRRDP